MAWQNRIALGWLDWLPPGRVTLRLEGEGGVALVQDEDAFTLRVVDVLG